MRVTLLSYGTRGDVQPFVALASALLDQGLDIVLAAPVNHRSFVERCGIPYAPLAGDIQAIFESEDGRRWLSSGNVAAFLQAMMSMGHRLRHELMRDIAAACVTSDAIISQVVIQDLALIMAEKRRVPLMYAHLFPMCRSSEFACPFVTSTKLPLPVLNTWTHDLFNTIWWQVARRDINELRATHGLSPIHLTANVRGRRLKTPVLQVFSPHVLPRPQDWGDEHFVTGFWQLPDRMKAKLNELEPPAQLVDWLASGPPPVYFGFGSMPIRDSAAVMAMVKRVCGDLGIRAVVGAGWADLGSDDGGLSDDVVVVRSVNHDWLFPQCSAVIHHGGAGTTGASLRAGKPTLVGAVYGDQPFWGKRVAALGVGDWMPFGKLSRDSLVRSLRHLSQERVIVRAAALGEALRQEDGLANAVTVIARHLASAPVP